MALMEPLTVLALIVVTAVLAFLGGQARGIAVERRRRAAQDRREMSEAAAQYRRITGEFERNRRLRGVR